MASGKGTIGKGKPKTMATNSSTRGILFFFLLYLHANLHFGVLSLFCVH